ncbi:MAG: Ig-like domain-containing protein, partial [Thermoflexales bacterium]|nr:Ig-like domain-containing protein [Thermoflexales bacterium]
MTKGFERVARLFFLGVIVLAGCGAPAELPTPAPLTPQVTLQPSTPTATTPTPRPPSSPLVIDRLPARGEELQPDQPIEIVFDQPMDRRSVEQALQVRASDGTLVAGTLTWKSDSVVVFKPAQPWLQAERYTVSLAAEAKSAKGFALARPEQFEVNTVGKLAVAQTLPQDGAMDVTADAAITVLFNRPVVPLTALSEQSTLPQPLVLEPTVEGRGEWLNTSIYLFRPTQPLQAGVAYRARVPAGLRDTTGSVLDADYGWTFTVAPPVVKFVLPAPGSPPVDLRQPITVVFSQRMDRASAQAAFSIQPPVRGSFRWSEETPDLAPAPGAPTAAGEPTPSALLGTSRGEVMTFIPEENYERGQGYVVTVRAGARAAAGSGATTQPTVFGFTTFPLPEVIGTVPADGATQADPNSSFVIRFNAPISVPTILPNLTFEPPVSLTRVYSFYDRFSNEFFLGVQLAPSTAYRVRIGGGATDQYGVPLGKDTEVRFTTAPLQPFVALENEGFVGVYNASRPTRLFVAHRNVTRIDLELVRLSLEEFYQFTGAVNSFERVQTYKPQPEALLRRWSERVTPELNQLKRLRLDLVEGGGSLPTGVYLLSVSAPELNQPETNPVQVVRHILVVSDLHVTLKHGDTSGLVWVTDLNTSQPLGGVEVTFRDHTFSEIARAQTSSAADTLGQALVSLPASYKPYRTLYAVVGQPGGRFGIAWSEMSRGIAIYDFGLPGRYFAEPYLVYLFTDRPIYRPGQRVFFKGYVRRDNDARYSLPDVPAVQVAIESFNGFRVFSQTLRLDDNGGFEGELALDQRITPGTYFIQVCVPLQPVKDPEEPTCAFGSTFFAVAAYRAPEFEVSVSADKTDYLDGEIMQFTIEARYFFGGAAANASVRWSLMAEDYLFDRYRGPGLYDFGDYDVFSTDSRLFPGFSEPVANGEGVTDSQGRLVLRLPADLSKRRTSARFTLEATVTDANDQSASARQSVVAHKAPVYFGVSTEGYVYEVGSPITVNVIAVDWQGKPLAGQTGELVFSQREWMTVQEEDPQGQVFYTSNPSDTVISKITITTDAEGRASATFTPQAGGEHRVKIANAARSIFVADPSRYVGWRIENNDRIELQADKDTYEVGEVARVLVPSPFQGTVSALLTVERGSFLQRRTLTLNNNSTVLEIPIEESFAPNAYVSVLLVKGVDATNPVPAFRLGYTSFRVSP